VDSLGSNLKYVALCTLYAVWLLTYAVLDRAFGVGEEDMHERGMK
jgi:hypothetical protein